MAEINLEWIGSKLVELIETTGRLEKQISAMRSEIDGGFHMMRGTDERVEGLRRIVDAHGQRITALEKQ